VVTDNLGLSKGHWYRFLPRRLQTIIVSTGIKLGLIKKYGKIQVVVHDPKTGKDKKSIGYNLMTNAGIKHLGDILVGTETTNLDIAFIEPGSGTTPPDIQNLDIESGLTPVDRLPVGSQTRSSTAPFEVTVDAFINSSKYTRPQTINELAIYFGPDESGDLFARSVLGTGITLNAGNTATLTYSFIWR
jgi:hypothetical protein